MELIFLKRDRLSINNIKGEESIIDSEYAKFAGLTGHVRKKFEMSGEAQNNFVYSAN